jgi:chorismate dehydratase
VSRPVRLGAVNYLNVRPLVYGLEAHRDRVTVRYDPPAECARLLARGEIDLGMIPSVAYLDRPADRVVPGVCIGSDGPVASVALFTRKPVSEITRIALDTSSRTSAMLVRVLCARRFGISPTFVPHSPDLGAMLAVADAALIIGDEALFVDYGALGTQKIDLGAAWSEMTGLPFVWAFWAGPAIPEAAGVVDLLGRAAEAGMAHTTEIARAYCANRPERIPVADQYLKHHLAFELTPKALQGLRTYYAEAARVDDTVVEAEVRFLQQPTANKP